MTPDTDRQATFFRAALLLGLVRCAEVVTWAEETSPVVMRKIFRAVLHDSNAEKRNVKDTVTILSQIRRNLAVSAEVLDQIDTLEDDFMLASAGVTADVRGVERRVREWLTQFSDAGEATP